MSRKPVVLVTGANGEVGHGLITALAKEGRYAVVALDLREIDAELKPLCAATISGDILDTHLLDHIASEYEIHAIFHLAALLSTRSEFVPETAHAVNVEGTLRLLKLAMDEGKSHGQPVKFLFPSSIAVYGLPDLEAKAKAGAVSENEWTTPRTMYGCNKLYCEQLGRYYADFYRQLAVNEPRGQVDFRSIRFPGLISAFTVPSGGTSDYVPEMLHAAAKGEAYKCFVRADSRITFMAMPDAIDALLALMRAPMEKLSTRIYNIGAFNPSAGEFADLVREEFPGIDISFVPHEQRQVIVDSWPEDVIDDAARRDWGFEPSYDLKRAMTDYLIPNIKQRYA